MKPWVKTDPILDWLYELKNFLSCQNQSWVSYPLQWFPTFVATGVSFWEDSFSIDWGVGMWGIAQAVIQAMEGDGEQQIKFRWLTHLPYSSCCVARFLTGHRQYWPKAQGLGTSALYPQKSSDIWPGCYTKVLGLNSLENKKSVWGYGIYIVMTLLILKL